MIQASELMIGSIIVTPNGVEPVNRIICGAATIINGFSEPNIHPVPLTPVVLAKCGATSHPDESLYLDNIHVYEDYHGYYMKHGRYVVEKVRLKYLHELQRLYLSVKGEALEVRL